MEKFKYFLYTIFLFALIAFSVSFISIHADAKTLQGDALSGATTRENFLKQGNAEIIVAGVSNYVNAGATPTTCAGGMPSGGLTVAREKSKAMSGDFYWKITKDSSNQQGEGIAFDFTVDGFTSTEQVQQELYAKVKVIAGSFLFGTDTVSSDIGFYLYDVTANKLVTLAGGNDILGSEVKRWFTPTKDSTQYRLCVHVQTTATNAFTLGLDDLFAGKAQPISTGAVVTKSDEYVWTPIVTGLGAGSGTVEGVAGRVGDSLVGSVRFTKDSVAGSGGGTVTFSLPDGLEIDYSKLPQGGSSQIVGPAISNTSLTYTSFSSAVNSTYPNLLVGLFRGSTGVVDLLSGASLSANSIVLLKFSIPIKGWGGTVELADQYLGRDIYFRAFADAVSVGTAESNILYGTVNEDTVNGYNPVTGYYTIPSDGLYVLTADAVVGATGYAAGSYVQLRLYTGVGTSTRTVRHSYQSNSSNQGFLNIAQTRYLPKGTVVYVGVLRDNTMTSATVSSVFTIAKINSSTQAFRPPMYNPADVTTDEVRVGTDWTVTPPKPLYQRCYIPASDITTAGTTTLTTWSSNLKPTNAINFFGTAWQIYGFTTDINTRVRVVYEAGNGELQATIAGAGYKVGAGINICLRYTKP